MAGREDAPKTEITFLGTDAVVPECGGDTASFVINRKLMVDTGWYGAIKMRCYGLDPMTIETLILTHCHHDHYIGLPQLLFYLTMRASERPNRPPLKIIGPAEDLPLVVELAQQFLQSERFPAVRHTPELFPLKPGESYEESDFLLTTCASLHPVPGLCYRFTDKNTGAVFAFTGDTAYDPAIVQHVQGVSLLIHEASYGASPAPARNASLHSGAPEAARVAIEAGVQRLALVHCPQPKQETALKAAQALFPNTFWPTDGELVLVE
jgi:ribonuclease Z